MFDPSLGRWLTEDPIGFEGGDSNKYRYVDNNPSNFVDPSGLAKVAVWITFVSDTATSFAGFWHSATATISEIASFGIIDGRVTIKAVTLADAVAQLKKRLGPNDCISFLEFVSHGDAGGWWMEYPKKGKGKKKKPGGYHVLTSQDLLSCLSTPAHREGRDKEIYDSLMWLKSKICRDEKVKCDLMICDQAKRLQGALDTPETEYRGVNFCWRLAKILDVDVRANDGGITGVGQGSWWTFPSDGGDQIPGRK